MVTTVGAILWIFHLGARRGRTVVEVFSQKADAAVVDVLKKRWPWPGPDVGTRGPGPQAPSAPEETPPAPDSD
ncbi:hypothetical protein OAX78_01450 [Planctomycetota bacterium]|nr:hypothetical protein [Planctomycetota bacterium]